MNLVQRLVVAIAAASTIISCSDDKLTDAECRYRQQYAKEVCNNIDDDCDGVIDMIKGVERCGLNGRGIRKTFCIAGVETYVGECEDEDKCKIGTKIKFYTGPESTRNTPPCHEGEMECQDIGGLYADFVRLQAEQTPEREQCDRIDNDCNGIIDDRAKIAPDPCWDPRVTEEQKGVGACINGWRACGEQECYGAGFPTEEICDKIDNNCDGETDEGLGDCPIPDECTEGEIKTFYTGPDGTEGVGACQGQEELCIRDGQQVARWFVQQEEITPTEESCTDLDVDKNCNGKPAREELRMDKAYVLFFLDKTGSFNDQEQIPVATAMLGVMGLFQQQGMTNYRYALVNVPSIGDDSKPELKINYTTAADFITRYVEQTADKSSELFYDAFTDTANPANPYGLLAIPSDAKEIYVGFTDGGEYTVRGLTETEVANSVTARKAKVFMFIPEGDQGLVSAFNNITRATEGAIYDLPEYPNATNVQKNLEEVVLRCPPR